MAKISVSAPDGTTIDLSVAHRDEGPVLAKTGLQGLKGVPEDEVMDATVWSGQVYLRSHATPMTGSLTVGIFSRSRQLEDRMAEWRAMWPTGQYAVIRLETKWAAWSLRVRATEIEDHPDDSLDGAWMLPETSVALISDGGLWEADPDFGEGTVTVTNYGDAIIFPQIRWNGPGGTVTMPSGANFTLPPVTTERVIMLTDEESCAVFLGDDLDTTLWPLPGAVAEGIPPRQSRTFTVPTDAQLEWTQKRFDPWRL